MRKLVFAITSVIVISVTGVLIYLSLPPKIKPVARMQNQITLATATTLKNTNPTANKIADINVDKLITNAAKTGLKPKPLKAALNSYIWAREHGKLGKNKKTLTVIDFSLPSYEKRMWVLDLENNKVLMKLYTTHGKGSGMTYATHFSNRSETGTSSLGLYVTSEIYYGNHDKSIRIDGLEKGINSNARSRNIVIHSAYYATPEYVRTHGVAGRSWGCFAIAPEAKNKLLEHIKGGSVLFTYAPQEDHDPIVRNGPISIV